MHLPRLLFLLLLLALTGCETVRYRMIPPPSESGRFCVTQCAGIMEMCIGHERSMAHLSNVNVSTERIESTTIACAGQKTTEVRERSANVNVIIVACTNLSGIAKS